MKRSALEFQISQLRQQKMVLALQSIMVFIAALFTTALLPQILFKYMYANAQLTEEPVLLARIPDVCFAVAAIYFIYAVLQGIMITMKLAALEKEAMTAPIDDVCCVDCGENCNCLDHENCLCGCEEDEMEAEVIEVEMAPASKMAEKMKTASKKKVSNKRK